eukprot:1488653-Amphidinium_carterae.1
MTVTSCWWVWQLLLCLSMLIRWLTCSVCLHMHNLSSRYDVMLYRVVHSEMERRCFVSVPEWGSAWK